MEKSEMNIDELNEVTGGRLELGMETVQQYCTECGHVFGEIRYPKEGNVSFSIIREANCPVCQKLVSVASRYI